MFFQKKLNKEGSGNHEINMTPLIDVSLVLVVMLLLATPLALESSIAVRNAHKSSRKAKKEKLEERIELNVVSEDSVRVNRNLVARRKLHLALRPLLEQNESRVVLVQCGENVSHGAFVDVLDQAKVCGASEIAVSGE
ncbi:MAG: biopolymer transporter ExbD [Candidatus Latescibacterota bacterium]|jgi:biopolymer transport protein TolR